MYNQSPSCSCNSQSSPELSQDSPSTSTTVVSNNPFDFTVTNGNNNMQTQQHMVHAQPVRCPPDGMHHVVHSPALHANGGVEAMDYPQRSGSLKDQFPMYPILENPPPYPHQLVHSVRVASQSSIAANPAGAAAPVCFHHSGSSHSFPYTANDTDMIMTDNPHFEEEVSTT